MGTRHRSDCRTSDQHEQHGACCCSRVFFYMSRLHLCVDIHITSRPTLKAVSRFLGLSPLHAIMVLELKILSGGSTSHGSPYSRFACLDSQSLPIGLQRSRMDSRSGYGKTWAHRKLNVEHDFRKFGSAGSVTTPHEIDRFESLCQ